MEIRYFYEIRDGLIELITIWDSRQDCNARQEGQVELHSGHNSYKLIGEQRCFRK
jgi:hypothetical protein